MAIKTANNLILTVFPIFFSIIILLPFSYIINPVTFQYFPTIYSIIDYIDPLSTILIAIPGMIQAIDTLRQATDILHQTMSFEDR